MNRLLKTNILLRGINNNVYDSRLSQNINYWYNVGILLGIGMVIQIVSGVLLSFYYLGDINTSFNSIEYIMLEIRMGNIIRSVLANGVSLLFILIYLLISKGLYNGSYITPRENVWKSGVALLLLLIVVAFLGYSLVCGIQSYWAIIVITNLLSSIPYIGSDIVTLIWSGYSPNTLTIKRFYSLLYLLPFIILGLIIVHIILLLELNGTNIIGVKNNTSIINFLKGLTIKDIFVIGLYLLVVLIIVTIYKNKLSDYENNIEFNALKTPAAIVPLWYLLTYYAILRSIPNKLLGVIMMMASILSLIIISLNNISLIRSSWHRLVFRWSLIVFLFCFLTLLRLGAKLPSYPYSELSLFFTIFYFIYLIVLIPVINLIDNTLLFYRSK